MDFELINDGDIGAAQPHVMNADRADLIKARSWVNSVLVAGGFYLLRQHL